MIDMTIRSAAALLFTAAALQAQQGTPQFEPTNKLPNPYETIEGWAKMPEGRTWGSTSAVEIDRDGVSIWVAERCGANSCANSQLPSVLKFDANGNLVNSAPLEGYPINQAMRRSAPVSAQPVVG